MNAKTAKDTITAAYGPLPSVRKPENRLNDSNGCPEGYRKVGVSKNPRPVDFTSLEATAREMQALMRDYGFRPFELPDGSRAGIYVPAEAEKRSEQAVRRIKQLFFGPHHADICRIFERGLQFDAEHYAALADRQRGR